MFAHYVILMMTLHNVQWRSKLKKKRKMRAGVEKVKLSENPDNLITKIF